MVDPLFALSEWDSVEMKRSKLYKALIDTNYDMALAAELLGITRYRLIIEKARFKIYKPHKPKVK
jgi:transcriptional regulator with GAF, ATPase, and Fis domain